MSHYFMHANGMRRILNRNEELDVNYVAPRSVANLRKGVVVFGF
jgi:hypothetical protein